MANSNYNRNNNGGGYGNNYPDGNRAQYGGNYNNNGGGQRQPKKHSGCGMKEEAANGQPCIYGWRYVPGQGKFSFVSSPFKSPKTKSERWLQFCTTVTRPDGSQFLASTLWDTQKKRLKFTKGGQVANPYAQNGGYWGKGGYKMNIRTNNR